MKDISIISIEGVDYNVEDKVARSRQSVQSDWSEEDTESGAYIRNKPSVYSKAEVDAMVGGIRAVYDAVNERLVFPTGSAVVVNERLIIL